MTSKGRTAIEQIEWARNVLAALLVGAFVLFSGALLWKAIPSQNEQLLSYMLGQLSGMAITALSFYFVNKVGQDALDATRTANTGKAFSAIEAAAKSGVVDGSAIHPGDTVTLDKPGSEEARDAGL